MTKTDVKRQRDFLEMIRARQPSQVAQVWNYEYREALSSGQVKRGWGGKLALTPAGRALLDKEGK